MNIAAEQGATVIATTRRPERAALLERLGAKTVLIDDGRLADQEAGVINCVFDLVGNRVLRDSVRIVRPRGRVCQLGFLGGLDPVAGFNPIADLPSGVQFSFYGSAFVLGTSEFPLTEIPLTEMIRKAENGLYQAKPARVFGFDDIVEAHQVMEVRPGRRQDDRIGNLTRRCRDPGIRGAAGEAEDEPVRGDSLHAGAGVREELADRERPEAPGLIRTENASSRTEYGQVNRSVRSQCRGRGRFRRPCDRGWRA